MKKKKEEPVTMSDVLDAIQELTKSTKEGLDKLYKLQRAGKF